MEKNNDLRFELIEGIPNAKKLKTLLTLYQSIFEDARPKFFKQRLNEKEDVLSIVAIYNGNPVGFKIGYRYDKQTFYSWVGGILKSNRNKGIAKQLSQLQQDWAKNKNYIKIRTKSMNRFKPMMILNLKNGFDIKEVYTNDSGQTKIIFEKYI